MRWSPVRSRKSRVGAILARRLRRNGKCRDRNPRECQVVDCGLSCRRVSRALRRSGGARVGRPEAPAGQQHGEAQPVVAREQHGQRGLQGARFASAWRAVGAVGQHPDQSGRPGGGGPTSRAIRSVGAAVQAQHAALGQRVGRQQQQIQHQRARPPAETPSLPAGRRQVKADARDRPVLGPGRRGAAGPAVPARPPRRRAAVSGAAPARSRSRSRPTRLRFGAGSSVTSSSVPSKAAEQSAQVMAQARADQFGQR